MYADDTHLSFAANNIPDIESKLNEDLTNVNEWLIANRLTLNSSKTESQDRGGELSESSIRVNVAFN
jgi:hypothetical protein